MRGLNKVMIIGHIGREPELRYTSKGAPVTKFDVAVVSHSKITADGSRHDETEWFNVVTWGRLAEICKKNLARGQQVYIEGRLQTRSWEDDSGKRHFSTEIVARDMRLLGERKAGSHEEDFDGDLFEDDLD